MKTDDQKMVEPSDAVQIKKLIRQHVHDVRNYVNCVGLEVALIGETLADDAAVASVESIRDQLQELDRLLRKFSDKFSGFPDC